ncbi:MAG: hypothetical protein FJ146_12655 [Deltaproteobacteria bacterium]|nr:hypothetical protein [Deltaproteobacteria bacterium]
MRLSQSQLVIALGLSLMAGNSCRSANNKGAEVRANAVEAGSDLKAQVASFDAIRARINDLNRAESSKAADKLATLWDHIVATKQDDDRVTPAAAGAAVFVFGNGSAERFWRIFTGWSTFDGGSEVRPSEKVPDILKSYIRLTHRYGVFAKLKYVPTDAAKKLYTGQFAEGNDHVLGRFSSAVPPSVADRFTPAVAAKFFLDGRNESQVLITQHDVGGQSVGKDRIYNNFFEKPLSNRLSFENNVESGVGAFSRFLYTAIYFSKKLKLPYEFDPRELQADHLAEFTPDGREVANPRGPRFVWTVAGSAAIKAHFHTLDKPKADYRQAFLSLNKSVEGVEGSGKTEGGIVVMRLYGSDTWTYNPEANATLLGEFVTSSPVVASDAADQRLFFRHAISFFHPTGVDQSEERRFEVRAERGHSIADNADRYSQDYPFDRWSSNAARDELFTSHCRLGVKEDEIRPFPTSSSLQGTFIAKAIATRKSPDGKYCAPDVFRKLAAKGKEKASDEQLATKVIDEDDQTLEPGVKDGLAKYLKTWLPSKM